MDALERDLIADITLVRQLLKKLKRKTRKREEVADRLIQEINDILCIVCTERLS
jgi:folate-dependent tRNA-U54 methylase TrmFO/GidA